MSIDFRLTDEERLLKEAARDFAEGVLMPEAAALDREERFSTATWRRLGELGFLGMQVPASFGGSGLSAVAQCLVLEELNRGSAAMGVAASVQNSLVEWPIVRIGNEEQKRRYLPGLAAGELIGCYGLTEPGCGSDAAALQTRAEKRGSAYVLNGRKAWVTNGASADLAIIFATLDRSRGKDAITAFLVETDSPGFSAGKKEKKLGIRASESAELVIEDVEVPESSRLGAEGEGFSIALETLDGGRLGIAAQALGILRASLEASARYALEREQFGRPIASFQPIQWKIADMAVDLEAGRLLTLRAAWLRDGSQPHRQEASMAKLFTSEAANRAADQAVQIHGGAGYCTEFPVERYFRDAKVTEIYEGTSEIQRLIIAREVLREFGAEGPQGAFDGCP